MIRHNMEIAHRLSLTAGKCQQIHGHGMRVELVLLVTEGPEGMALNSAMETLEYGDMKRKFRQHIDSTYDHRLVLNAADPWAGPIMMVRNDGEGNLEFHEGQPEQIFLPGLSLVPGDPTVENLSKWIAEWSALTFRCDVICRIDETKTNGAEVMFHWNGFNAKMVEGAR
jgi:6-pyruvoyl-tetrahydropterin synthase